ncbi:hypothetical protein QZH41_003097 [Actinostola sp. cb2023]|nr:hypothetical protein QZH41_003097 [Actinostola sp. cb2023]
MDLVYSTVWETVKKTNRRVRDVCGKVTVDWSSRNLIAFTTGYKKIQDPNGKSNKQHISNAIHIVDPDSPWDTFSSGSKLLSIDLGGQCNVWTMKDYLINDWQCETVANVGEGERLVSVSWIDNGIKVLYCPTDEQHSAKNKQPFEEQFKSSSNKPPYTEFGGKAQDGWVSVTETGLVCVTTTKPEVKTTRQSLSAARHHIAVADLAYTNPTEYTVCDIQFLSKNSGEIVLVCTSGPFGTYIKRWDMRKEKVEKFQKVTFRTHSGVQPTIFVSLGRNAEVLGIMKEMLVLIRLWDKKDSLALLFKIITKMWIHCKQPSEGQEFEDRLAAEASPLLPNQLFILNMKAPNLNRVIRLIACKGLIYSYH